MNDIAITASSTTTKALVQLLMGMRGAPEGPAVTVAKQCLLDWLGVTLAARREPLVRILADGLDPDAGRGATVLGLGRRARIDDAVLVNGAAGHALDFDDVIAVMGHPTAPVAPVVLALSEERGASGAEALAAFIAGVEAECRVAALMGGSHYADGWHGTATYGTFGATVAAAQLLSLEEDALLHALGLAGTQAAGLKSVFGTMSKPLHAGKAAANGLLAARLASRGFTSDVDILGSDQGFAGTQSRTVDPSRAIKPRRHPYVADALFKYHAACYLTHNAIEAANLLRVEDGVSATEVVAANISVQPGHLDVCNIESPSTGLECKFSLRMTVALALTGEDTFDDRLFSDATAARQDLVELCRKTSVEPTAPTVATRVRLTLADGREIEREADVSTPVRDLPAQQEKLERKFRHLTRDVLEGRACETVIEACRNLECEPSLERLLAASTEGLLL
jgi:2-methylcitrate dehydratase PrpD